MIALAKPDPGDCCAGCGATISICPACSAPPPAEFEIVVNGAPLSEYSCDDQQTIRCLIQSVVKPAAPRPNTSG